MYKKLKDKLNKVFDAITLKLFKRTYGDNIKHPVLIAFFLLVMVAVLSIWMTKEYAIPIAAGLSILLGWSIEKLDEMTGGVFSKRDIFNTMVGIVIAILIAIFALPPYGGF